jgi:hypothetical protein
MKRTAAALAMLAAFPEVVPAAELPKFEIPRLGIFRKKKEDPPATPPQQQPAPAQPDAKPAKATAVDVLKADRDEKKRLAAAEALRTADPRTSPDVLPALTTSLQQDPSANVRAAVAQTIGKLKPVSAEAGAVLEATVAGDPAEAVRKAAQQALWEYHLNGYRSAAANAAMPQTAEPPLAKPKAVPAKPAPPVVLTSKTPAAPTPAPATPVPAPRPITTGIGKGAIYPQTVEPPLAKPKVEKVEVKPPTVKVDAPPQTPPTAAVPGIPTPMPPSEAAPISVPVPPAPSGIPTIPPPGK